MARRLSFLVAVLALVAAACGGGDTAETTTTTAAPDTTTSAPDTTTTAAPETTTTTATTLAPAEIATLGALIGDDSLEATSARFEGTFAFVTDGTAGLPADFAMMFSGAFNAATESSQISVDFGDIIGALGEEVPPEFGGFFSEPMEIITIGTTSYIKWGLFSFFTGTNDWIEFTDQDPGAFVSEFSFGLDATGSPIDSLEQLADAGAEVEIVGTETIRGVETTHYRVIADVETLAAELPEDEAAELREAFGEGGLDGLEFDIYLADGLLYRYAFAIDATGLPDAEGIEGLTVQFDIFDYNEDIVIEAPENAVSGDELGGIFDSFFGNF